MRRYLKWFAAGLAFCVGGALAANLPFLTPQTAGNDFLPAINQLINQLNGGPGYAGAPQIVSLGPTCISSGLTCNGQSGTVQSSNLTNAALATASFSINNSFVNQTNKCVIIPQSYSGTLGTNGIPVITQVQPGPGFIGIFVTNVHATNALNGALTVIFACF